MITVALALFAFIGVRAEEKETVQSPAFADLPSGYRQLEYIDTDGNQWVNTRFLPACTNAVEIKASFTNTTTGSDQYLFCTQRSTEGTDRRRFYLNISGSGKSEFGFRNSVGGSVSIPPSVPHVFFAAPDKTDIYTEIEDAYYLTGYVDGKQAGNKVAGKDFTPAAQAYFCLFGGYTGSLTDETVVSSKAVCRFWYFKVWETKDKEKLLCHIIPVYDVKEEKIGFYDLVAERFLPVSGSPVPTGTYALTEDVQWFDDKILLSSGMTIDLSGHNLTIDKASPFVVVNEVSPVNAEYQDLAHLTVLGGESITVPGFRLPGTAKVEMKFRPSLLSKTQFLFSSRRASDKKYSYGALINTDGTVRFDFYSPNDSETSSQLTASEDHLLVFDGSGGPEGEYSTWSLDGVPQTAPEHNNNFTSGGDLCLFNVGNDGANPAECRLYYFTVTTKDGNVSLDLHPVRRISDGAVGLYDRVGGVFYESTSSKAFTFTFPEMPKFVNSSEVDSELRVGRALLSEYTVVECITASEGQYVDTGFIPAATDRLEMRASLSDVSVSSGIFCSRVGLNDREFAVVHLSDGFRFDFNNKHDAVSLCATENVPFTVALDGNACKGYVNDNEHSHTGKNIFIPSARIYLFAMHKNNGDASSTAKGSIYYFKAVGADGTVKVDMIPVVRSDNVPGLYDRVRRKFYPSASATPFTAGAVAGDGKLYGAADYYLAGAKIADNAKLKLVEGTVSGVVFEDGGAIDLSEFTGPFSLDGNKVAFADDATVEVCLGSRKVLPTEPVISWSEAPANLDRIRFEFPCDDGTSAKGWKEDDGIYFRRYGLVISVK